MDATSAFLSIINNNSNTFITQQTVINNYPIISQQSMTNNSNNKNTADSPNVLNNNDNPPLILRRSKRKRKTINYNFNSNGNNLDRSELEKLSLDELLAKAMGSIRNLRWDRDNEWCRYCGSRGSPSFFYSPWGKRKLCYLHFKQWKKNELCLSIFDEPVSIDAPINKADCTEKEYLVNLLMECNECSDNACTDSNNMQKKTEKDSDVSEYDDHDSNVNDVDVTERKDDNMYLMCTEKDTQREQNSKIAKLMELSNALKSTSVNNKSDMDMEESSEESDFSTESMSNESESSETEKGSKVNFRSILDKIMPILPPKRRKATKKDIVRPEEPFECTQCCKLFDGKRGLRDHIRNEHTRMFKCNFCDKGFNTQKYLKTHMINNHRKNEDTVVVQTPAMTYFEEKPFKCGKCGKKFKSLGYLHGHMDRVHVARENNKKLEKNVKIHSKKKAYKCKYCYRRFRLKQYARKHEKNMHSNELLTQRPKDEHCPKKPLTSFFLYCQQVRGSIITRNPGLNMTEVSKEIGRKWRALSDNERGKYKTKAENAFKKYKITFSEYKRTRKYKKYKKKLTKWRIECSRRKKKQLRKVKKERARLEKILQSKNEDNDTSSDSDSELGSGSSSSSD